jgi:uncharacterized phage protein (TIGR01671 family)
MREIKFRAKEIGSDGEWRVGDLHITATKPHIHSLSNKYLIKIETIGQFTGLHDSIGREIYEGDIIKSSFGTLHYIVYDNDLACFKAVVARYNPLGEYETLSKGWVVQFNKKVIGNIHDNPGK